MYSSAVTSFVLGAKRFTTLNVVQHWSMCSLKLLQGWKVQPLSGGHVSRRQSRRFTIWWLLATRRQPSRPLTFTCLTFIVGLQGEKLHFVDPVTNVLNVFSIIKGRKLVPPVLGKCTCLTINYLARKHKDRFDAFARQQSFRLFVLLYCMLIGVLKR